MLRVLRNLWNLDRRLGREKTREREVSGYAYLATPYSSFSNPTYPQSSACSTPLVNQAPPPMDFLNQSQSSLGNIPGGIHELRKNLDKFCSKFEFGGIRTAEEHIEAFKDALVQNNIQHEDVACHLFPYFLGDNEYH